MRALSRVEIKLSDSEIVLCNPATEEWSSTSFRSVKLGYAKSSAGFHQLEVVDLTEQNVN